MRIDKFAGTLTTDSEDYIFNVRTGSINNISHDMKMEIDRIKGISFMPKDTALSECSILKLLDFGYIVRYPESKDFLETSEQLQNLSDRLRCENKSLNILLDPSMYQKWCCFERPFECLLTTPNEEQLNSLIQIVIENDLPKKINIWCSYNLIIDLNLLQMIVIKMIKLDFKICDLYLYCENEHFEKINFEEVFKLGFNKIYLKVSKYTYKTLSYKNNKVIIVPEYNFFFIKNLSICPFTGKFLFVDLNGNIGNCANVSSVSNNCNNSLSYFDKKCANCTFMPLCLNKDYVCFPNKTDNSSSGRCERAKGIMEVIKNIIFYNKADISRFT